MNDSERQHLEQRLLEERDRAQRALQRLDEVARISTEDDGELTQYRQHPADEGTDSDEQEKGMLLLSRDSKLLTTIDNALLRLYKEPERYGVCENCGRQIEFERLEFVPWAKYCLDCKRLEEAS